MEVRMDMDGKLIKVKKTRKVGEYTNKTSDRWFQPFHSFDCLNVHQRNPILLLNHRYFNGASKLEIVSSHYFTDLLLVCHLL